MNATGVDTTGDGELDRFGIPVDTTGDGLADAIALGDSIPDTIVRTSVATAVAGEVAGGASSTRTGSTMWTHAPERSTMS